MERADGKAAGDDGFIPARGSGWQMERAPAPYQTRRAVRVVTGPLHRMWQVTGSQIATYMPNILVWILSRDNHGDKPGWHGCRRLLQENTSTSQHLTSVECRVYIWHSEIRFVFGTLFPHQTIRRFRSEPHPRASYI
jgi:hypothetical protein